MKHYENPPPRALFVIAAVILTALSIGLFAVVPAHTGPSARTLQIASAAARTQAGPAIATPAQIRYIEPVYVVAQRTPKVLSARERETPVKRGDQG
ncbi:MAG: hypothetical protein ABIR52_01985 [Casimicrobiaceae bacterium]